MHSLSIWATGDYFIQAALKKHYNYVIVNGQKVQYEQRGEIHYLMEKSIEKYNKSQELDMVKLFIDESLTISGFNYEHNEKFIKQAAKSLIEQFKAKNMLFEYKTFFKIVLSQQANFEWHCVKNLGTWNMLEKCFLKFWITTKWTVFPKSFFKYSIDWLLDNPGLFLWYFNKKCKGKIYD